MCQLTSQNKSTYTQKKIKTKIPAQDIGKVFTAEAEKLYRDRDIYRERDIDGNQDKHLIYVGYE